MSADTERPAVCTCFPLCSNRRGRADPPDCERLEIPMRRAAGSPPSSTRDPVQGSDDELAQTSPQGGRPRRTLSQLVDGISKFGISFTPRCPELLEALELLADALVYCREL
jgi:hypothetical protein